MQIGSVPTKGIGSASFSDKFGAAERQQVALEAHRADAIRNELSYYESAAELVQLRVDPKQICLIECCVTGYEHDDQLR